MAIEDGTSYDLPEKLIGDHIRLKQVLINLTKKALSSLSDGEVKIFMSYDSQKEEITFRVARTNSQLLIEEEESIGSVDSEICREELEAMDDENFEGLSNTCLLISRKIVENCGGTMTMYKSSQRDHL